MFKPTYNSQSRRDVIFERAQGSTFTLDGESAKLVGRLLPFPVLVTDSGRRAELNWPQVETLVDRYDAINIQS